ncbi:uncharacterized protein C8A04DRAFT_12178 [Dichotomopilus funicola]|uniref:LRR-containing protein second PH domain-containing protein n=1 Tax=Dichotomopilus funicola TaxID=1934379 RepID=A0AAN6V433_9PEZI|nr:hypothetical protein C8A04DRAFT_12178 [Dichotomopilus funicola]
MAAPDRLVKKRPGLVPAVTIPESESSDSVASPSLLTPDSPASFDSARRSFSIGSIKGRAWRPFSSNKEQRDGTPDGGHSFRNKARRLSKSRPLSSSSHVDITPARRGSTLSEDHDRASLSTSDSMSLGTPSSPATTSVDWATQRVEGSAPLESDAGLLKTKTPHLVVTTNYVVKTKSRADAVALFPELSETTNAKPEARSALPEPALAIPMESIVSVFSAESIRTSFGIEVWWKSPLAGSAFCRSDFFFTNPAVRNEQLHHLTRAMRANRENDDGPARHYQDVKAALDKVHEVEEPRFHHRKADIIPVVPRGTTRREYMPKLEDATKKAQEVSAFYLVVGTYSCHLVEIQRGKGSNPVCRHKTYGLVTLESFRGEWVVHEERFNIVFRDPFKSPVTLELASRYFRQVIRVLGTADRFLKPAWPQLWQTREVFRVSGLKEPQYLVPKEDFGSFKRTLDAYLAAYHCRDVEWEINWKTQFAPEFRLLPGKKGTPYTILQLLAVLRALRYNDYFTSLSFRDVDLSVLHGLRDNSSQRANVAYLSRTCVTLDPDDIEILRISPVLHQEFHALAFCSQTIRQIDLSNCTRSLPSRLARTADENPSVQFLSPILRLLRSGMTKCNRLILTGNQLPQLDVDDLAETMKCGTIQALDVSYCGLGDSNLRDMIVEPLSDYPGLLQSLSVSGNPGRLPAHILPGLFRYLTEIRELNLSGSIQAESYIQGSLLPFTALECMERLEALDVSGYKLDEATFLDLERYLQFRSWRFDQGHPLRFQKLILNHCRITGTQAARLFYAIGENRGMHLYLNGNPIEDGLEDLTAAIEAQQGPAGLFAEMIEFRHESSYLALLRAFTAARHLRLLSLTGTAPSPSSPGPCSEELVTALHDLFAHNASIQCLDLSGFSGKLDDGQLPLGSGRALAGLAHNTTLTHLRIRNQNLHDDAGVLGRALAANATLRALDARGNDFNLTSLRFLVDSLAPASRAATSASALTDFPLPADERAAIWRNVLRGLQRTPSSVALPAAPGTVSAMAATSAANHTSAPSLAASAAKRDLPKGEEKLLREVLDGLFATLEKRLKENRKRLEEVSGEQSNAQALLLSGNSNSVSYNAAAAEKKRLAYRHRHQRSGSSLSVGTGLSLGGTSHLSSPGGEEDDDTWPPFEMAGLGLGLGIGVGGPSRSSSLTDSDPGGGGGNSLSRPVMVQLSEGREGGSPGTGVRSDSSGGAFFGGMESPTETLDPVSEVETPVEMGGRMDMKDMKVLIGEAETGRLSGEDEGEPDELFRKLVDDFRRAGFEV